MSNRPNPARLAISFCCWIIASPAVWLSFSVAIGPLIGRGRPIMPWHVTSAMAFAWLALAVMNLGWLARKKVHRVWPVAGTVCGLPCSLTYGLIAWPPIFCSVVPLAVYLVYFHLKKAAPSPWMHGTPAWTEHGR
jgi:hypothetical protein